MLTRLALYDKEGRPRILYHGALEGERIPTMHLSCTCDTATVSGLPCACMLAVARTSGAVLSYLHYHTHWCSNKLIKFPAPTPLFDQNQNRVLAVDVIVAHGKREDAPSRVTDDMKPTVPTVTARTAVDANPDSVITVGGRAVPAEGALSGVTAGDPKSKRKISRRFKSKIKNKK